MDRIERIKEMLIQDPKDAFLLFALAQEYQNSGELDTAISTYEELRKTNPDYVGLYYHLAKSYHSMSDTVSALTTIESGVAVAEKKGDHHAKSELLGLKMNIEIENL